MISLRNAIRDNVEDARAFVYRVLTFHICNMIFLPDEKLSEGEISAQMGVSRTPVHCTFAQLSHENMLVVESRRSTYVPRLDAERIRQLVWMMRTTTIGVFENLYINRPPKHKLEGLQQLVTAEITALENDDFAQLANLDARFYRELYQIAGLSVLHRALWSGSVDLYRLTRMDDHLDYWIHAVEQHAVITRALLKHNHESTVEAVTKQYEAIELLLAEMLYKNPQYFKAQENDCRL